jgi:hypothetical protein
MAADVVLAAHGEADGMASGGSHVATEAAASAVGAYCGGVEAASANTYTNCMRGAAQDLAQAMKDLAALYDDCMNKCRKKKCGNKVTKSNREAWRWLLDNPDYRKP